MSRLRSLPVTCLSPGGSFRPLAFLSGLALTLIVVATSFAPSARAATARSATVDRTTFSQSIAAVSPTATNTSGNPHLPVVTRTALSAAETSVSMRFEIALTMRNFAELEARLAHSEIIPLEEMQARYLPLAIDHDRVVRWLESEGMTVTRTDPNRLAIFAQAPVAEVARIFDASFARVTAYGSEYTAAISAPSLPATLAPAIRGIHGLQPYQRLRRQPQALRPLSATDNSPPFFPSQIARAYNANGLNLTGAGQTIAVYALAFPKDSDLTAFWAATGVPASLNNIQKVNVAGGPIASPTTEYIQEAALDIQWASALAPGATIRVYAASENDAVADDELIQEILADLPKQPGLHQLTISYGLPESFADRDYVAIEAQYMAMLVSQGVTVFAASGDNGALSFAGGSIENSFPASMPDVTAVGGTRLVLDTTGAVASEIAWGNLANSGRTGASGGGISSVFTRPTWQAGAGVPAGTMRLTPDVAAVGDPNTGALVVYEGAQLQFGGTSLSSPIWAAFCAMINQSRAAAGKAPLGALNPRLYPIATSTTAFRDITSGGNSVYAAGPGYDLCTGIGVPNVAALLQVTTSDTFAPVIEVQGGGRFTTLGQGATFYVVATSAPDPTYRWQRLPVGSSTWSDLANGTNYRDVTTSTLSISDATVAMSGDQFRCVISNSLGTITSPASTFTVGITGVSTLAGWPGWSGFADGQGSAGRFNYAGSARLDAAGTLYVADASNNTVRKITPTGIVSTLAGAPGVAGSVDGPGTVARFNGPAGVAIDSAGNVFVADSQNYTIRKITAAGIVSTFAGTAGSRGRTDGTGSAATFYDPQNLTIDATGNLYIADGAGNIVRKVTPAGVVTTMAGAAASGTADGTGSAARFNLLAGIAVDLAGNVYVGDLNNNAVRKITPTGVVTTLAGLTGTRNTGFVDGTGTAARFNGPTGMAVDREGTVYVADSFNNAIRKITAAGVVTTVAGSSSVSDNIDGPFSVARFNNPADVALGSTDGVIYIADGSNCTVRRIVLYVPTVPTIASISASQEAGLGGTLSLTVKAGGSGIFTYQWSKDGLVIPGATSATYVASTPTTIATAGTYTVKITSDVGTVTSSPVTVTVAGSFSRLTNLSVQAPAGGGQQLTLGFVLSGSDSKKILVRGIGPALTGFGLANALTDPALTVLGPNSSTSVAAANDNWNSADSTAIAATGAFPLIAGSKDAALIATLATGNYTAQITGSSTGAALAEVYDTDINNGARLINLSTLAPIASGGALTAGFTITGNVPKAVLIRGLGPALATLGVANVLADPRLELYSTSSGSTLLQTNDDWGATTTLLDAFTQTGAFKFGTAATKDAALLVTLPPGGYTAIVRGASGNSGSVLVEIYEVP